MSSRNSISRRNVCRIRPIRTATSFMCSGISINSGVIRNTTIGLNSSVRRLLSRLSRTVSIVFV
eukprot:5759796-Pyramimonas_sp.AAC.1